MKKIAVIGGSRPEIKFFIKTAMNKYNDQLEFHVFDTESNIDVDSLWHYHPCQTEEEMALMAVKFVHEGKADILVKGIVPTRTILKAVLTPEYSLKTQSLLSHVAVVQLPSLDRQLLLTDAAMNIAPDTTQLIEVTKNVLKVARKMDVFHPKIALLSSAETYNPKMPSSVNAQQVTEYFSNLKDAIVYGPLSFDLALSKEAVQHKGFEGPIMGDADVLVVPNIDVGNVLYKSLVLFGQAKMGGTIVGTKVPIVLTSRADSLDSKMIALQLAMSQVSSNKNSEVKT